jgi:superfamily II DNA or RNA helicase
MSVCKKLNRGANLIGVNVIIKESFDGSETDFQQTHGRLMRLKPEQTGYYIILVPYFEDLVRTENGAFRRVLMPTQVSKWASKMSASFDMSNSRVITLGNDLKFQGNEFT